MDVKEAVRNALEMFGIVIPQFEYTAASDGQGVVVMSRVLLMPLTNWDNVIRMVEEEGRRRVAAFDVARCEAQGAVANVGCRLHRDHTPNADLCRLCQHGYYDALVALADRGWK